MENNSLTQEEENRYEELQYLALGYARTDAHKELEMMLEAKLPLNLQDSKGNTLLMLAAYNGNYETTKMLLEHGANPNIRNDRGHSVLAGVAFKGYVDIARLLVAHGASLDKGLSRNPLVFATLFGRKEMVEYLISIQERSWRHKIATVMAKIFGTISQK